MRQGHRKIELEQRIWRYLNGHPSDIKQWIQEDTIDIQMMVTELLLLADMFQLLDEALLNRINIIYSLMVDSNILHDKLEHQLITFIEEYKQKFDLIYRPF